MKKYQIEIEGAFGEKNFGDDALLQVLHRRLCAFISPEDIVVRTKFGAVTRDLGWLCPRSEVIVPGDSKQIEVFHKVYGGGTQFYDFAKKSLSQTLLMYGSHAPRIMFRKVRQRLIFEGQKADKIHYIGVGIGPFHNDVISQKTISDMRDASTLVVRDSESERLLARSGISFTRGADICFVDTPPKPCDFRNEVKRVLLILRDWHHDSVFEVISPQVERLLKDREMEIGIALIGEDVRWMNWLQKKEIDFFKYGGTEASRAGLLEFMSTFDLTVSARYHGVIYSLLLGVPALSINIEPKLKTAALDLRLVGSLNPEELKLLPEKAASIDLTAERNVVREVVAQEAARAQVMLDAFNAVALQC